MRIRSLGLGGLAALVAVHASAQPYAPPDPAFQVVAPEQRLTLLRIFMDADPVVKLLMAGLLLATLVAMAAWIGGVLRAPGRAERLGGAVAYLSGLAAAGPLIGCFGASYTLLGSAVGLANVRPAPVIGVVAPGLAEALLCVALGLLAAAISKIGRSHLKARILAAPVEGATVAEAAPPTAPRLIREPG